MRHVCLVDEKISDQQFLDWKREDITFWTKYIGMTPKYRLIRVNYDDYPTYVDSDGDIRPTRKYLKELNKLATKQDGEFGCDFVMVMIHEDNWKSDTDTTKGIWGTNYSYIFGKQCLDYCRWDRNNPANTFGTAYHERFHSFDSIIAVETGVKIEPILKVNSLDREIVHGKGDDWDYIRHKENTRALKLLAPYLRKALSLREIKHNTIISAYEQIITLASQVLYLLRMKKYGKNGIPRG